MTAHEVTGCSVCGAMVIEALSLSGLKPVQINPSPIKDGNVQLRERPGDKPLAITLLSGHMKFGKTLYAKHSTTCSRKTGTQPRTHA